MSFKLLSHPVSQTITYAGIAFGVFLCVLPKFVPSFSWVVNYAVHIMLFYLVAGIFSLFIKQPKVALAFFAGCALLCLFLKFSIKNNDIERWRETVIQSRLPEEGDEPRQTFKIAHLNLSYADSVSSVMAAVRETNADIVSFHELTPDWGLWLEDSLQKDYPFRSSVMDIGIFGMSVFSKFKMESVDTFYFNEIPNLEGKLQLGEEQLRFINVHTEPALNIFSLQRLQAHLDSVTTHILHSDAPTVVVGEFNAVAWSTELQSFMDSTELAASRTGFMSFSNEGTSSLFDLPLDHIFFSPRIQCVGFENIVAKASNRKLGILGAYQFKPKNSHVE